VAEPRPGDVLGAYRLEELLGEGAVGVVFRAVREPDGDEVAIKVLRERLSRDGNYRARLLREARIARDLEHPNVVRVMEAGEDAGRSFLVEEHLRGRSLREVIDDGPLPLRDVVSLARDLASGLDAVHGVGLVHRDVKPSNVMIDPDRGALLMDFGLAKASAYTVLTKPGRVVGTLDYLAPELFRGEPASPLSDMYSFGCVLFEALVGSAPFAGRGFFEIGVAHLEEDPPDPATLRADVSAELSWAVLRALAKAPEERPPTATAYATIVRAAARET
jgi:serine/threonine protein kinase